MNKLFGSGNNKLPVTTAILNMGPASTCPSKRLGFCQAISKSGKNCCYAKKFENDMFKGVLPHRQAQEKYWKSSTAEQIAIDFLTQNKLKVKKWRLLRLNESGDFWSQKCIEKADKLAGILKKIDGVKTYCYSSRQDLDFSGIKNLVVMGSNFKKPGIKGIFKMVHDIKDKPKGYGICRGNCKLCHRCIRGEDTIIKRH